MPTMLFWAVMLFSALFGFVAIGGAARYLYGGQSGDTSAQAAGRQSKGAQEER